MTRRIFPMSDWAPAVQDISHANAGQSEPQVSAVAAGTFDHDRTAPVMTTEPISVLATSSNQPSHAPHNTNTLARSRSMSLSFASWRHRPKSAIIPEGDLGGRFTDMHLAAGNARHLPRGSVDELRLACRPNFQTPTSGSMVPTNDVFDNNTSAVEDEPVGEANGHGALTGAHGTGGKSAIKGMIRRASVSLHGFMQRRASFAGGKTTAGPADESAMAAGNSHFLPHLLRAPHGHGHSHMHSHPATHHVQQPQQDLQNTQQVQQVQQVQQAQPMAIPASVHQSSGDFRPSTSHAFPSWRRLRQAASFRQSRVFHDSDIHISSNMEGTSGSGAANDVEFTPYDHIYQPLDTVPSPREMYFFSPHDTPSHTGAPLSSSAPLPGGMSSLHGPPTMGGGPPFIPPNTGGAARAAAAAAFQQEMLQLEQMKTVPPPEEEYGNDHESGIGIAVTSTASDSEDDDTHKMVMGMADLGIESDGELGISKVDFIGKLPVELSVIILSQLDATALATAARVSRSWNTVVKNQHIWRESFLREKTATYATSSPVRPGVGLGVPPIQPSCDWRQIYRVKQELDQRWHAGKTCPVYLNGHTDSIYCLQFDESKIITGSRDRTIRIWDMHTLECRLVIGPPEIVRNSSLLYDEDGKPTHYISTAYHARTKYSTPAAVSFPMHHSASILCLQYDDNILVTGSSDSSCIVYSVKSGYRPVRRLRHHSAAVLDLCFDERYIVTCSKDISICVWDRETGQMLKQLRGHSGPVNAVQMRGNTIVSCSGDFRVKLWNIETGRAIRELTGHTKGLACSQFSEDGRFIASAGNDRVIRIWDANTGECLREMKAHENLVRSLYIDSVSGRLVSGSYDTDIKVFDMETGQLLLDFPSWHQSWVLSAKCDYRRIISTGQDPKILVMDFGAGIDGIELLESADPNGGNICGNVDLNPSTGDIPASEVTEQVAGYI